MTKTSTLPPSDDVVPFRNPKRAGLSAFAVLALLVTVCPALAAEDDAAVGGRVLGNEEPLQAAEVYAYDVATYALSKVTTDRKGRFLFKSLPAGLYKVIAHKPGFAPAVELLLRRSSEVRQDVELRLAEDKTGDVRAAEGYWDARRRIPADVLRQIQYVSLADGGLEPSFGMERAALLETRMDVEGGTTPLGDGQGTAQLTDAAVNLKSAVRGMEVGLDGRYLTLVSSGEGPSPEGEIRSMALSLAHPTSGQFSLIGSASELAEMRPDAIVPVDLEHYQLQWSGNAGPGDSAVSAQLIDENNYYAGGLQPANLPDASRTVKIQGSYKQDLTDRTSITTGVSYRQRQSLDPTLHALPVDDEVVGLYGTAGSQIQPRIFVEYGLYSSMREGDLSLIPHGGMVVKLGDDWEARTRISKRVEDKAEVFRRFNTAFFKDARTCQTAGEACYEVTFAHQRQGDEESFSIGAIHREFAETLRVYFSDDFFNRLESVLVVPGDSLPELRLRMVRRISPKVLAKLESNFASGGGGIFYATDDHAYENEVRYLVTSLDTRFQRTQTGVFVAFHHLEQDLNPITDDGSVAGGGSEIEVQRLQLMLTQDLSALANISPSLAVRVNMELSRGATPYTLTPDDALYKKLTGGISVSF